MKKHIVIGSVLAISFVAIVGLSCLLEESIFSFIQAFLHQGIYSSPLWVGLILPTAGILLSLLLFFGTGAFLAKKCVPIALKGKDKGTLLGIAFASGLVSLIAAILLCGRICCASLYFSENLVASFPLYTPRGIANAFALIVSLLSLSLPVFLPCLLLLLKRRGDSQFESEPRAFRAAATAFLSTLYFLFLPFFLSIGVTAFLNGGGETVYGLSSVAVFLYSLLYFVPLVLLAIVLFALRYFRRKQETT